MILYVYAKHNSTTILPAWFQQYFKYENINDSTVEFCGCRSARRSALYLRLGLDQLSERVCGNVWNTGIPISLMESTWTICPVFFRIEVFSQMVQNFENKSAKRPFNQWQYILHHAVTYNLLFLKLFAPSWDVNAFSCYGSLCVACTYLPVTFWGISYWLLSLIVQCVTKFKQKVQQGECASYNYL